MIQYRACLGLAAPLGSLAAACSPLDTFDRLVSKDRGGALVAKDLAYGPSRVSDWMFMHRTDGARSHDR